MLFLLSFFAVSAATDSPGVRFTLPPAGISQLAAAYTPQLLLDLAQAVIPDLLYPPSLATIPSVLSIKNITLSQLHLHDASLISTDLLPPEQVQIHIPGLSVSISFQWTVQSLIDSTGDGEVTIDAADLFANVSLLSQSNGQLTIRTDSVVVVAPSYEVDLTGSSLAWFYEMVLWLDGSWAAEAIQDGLAAAAHAGLAAGLEHRVSDPRYQTAERDIGADFSLLSPPVVTEALVEFQTRGAFFNYTDGSSDDTLDCELPQLLAAPARPRAVISESTLQSWVSAAYRSHLMVVPVFPMHIATNATVQMTTSFFEQYFPGLCGEMGDRAVYVRCEVTESPQVTVLLDGVEELTYMRCEFRAKGEKQAFAVVSATVFLEVSVTAEEFEVVMKVATAEVVKITVKSKFGDGGKGLKEVVNALLRRDGEVRLPVRGFELPHWKDIKSRQVTASSFEGYIVLEADLVSACD